MKHPTVLELKAMLEHAARLIRESSSCDACAAGEELWRGSDQPELLLHGDHDDVGECESTVIAEAVTLGIIAPVIYPRCPKGHDWYGAGCPECPCDHACHEFGDKPCCETCEQYR